jgi:cytidyltransferase-like protein
VKLRPHRDATSLQAAAEWVRNRDGIIGMTSGTFDLLHDFHLRFLKQCRRQCDILIVGIDSDRLVRERKGPTRPILSEWQREAVMNAVKYVEFVYVLDTLADYTTVAEVIGVQKVFLNEAFAGREADVAVGESRAQVVIVPDVKEHDSTSRIIAKIKAS